jgi:hypothetical protein
MAGINVELDEKRQLRSLPKVNLGGLKDGSFFRSFDNYFNDHFAYRVTLIKTKNWIDYYVFRTSPSPKVHVGIHNWLYLQRTAADYFKVHGCMPEEVEHMYRLTKQIHDLEEMVVKSGRQFVFVIAPNKSTIYPEYFGVQPPHLGECARSRYDIFLEALRRYPINGFVRLDSILRAAKSEGPIYYRTDTHWNLIGGRIASETILRKVAGPKWHDYLPRVTLANSSRLGDLSRMMSIDILETAMDIKNVDYMAPIQEFVMEHYDPERDRLRYIPGAYSERPYLPRTIFYRDSFGNSLIPYIKGAFRQLDVIWFGRGVEIVLRPTQAEELKASQIVVFEIVERSFSKLQIDLPEWEAALRR